MKKRKTDGATGLRARGGALRAGGRGVPGDAGRGLRADRAPASRERASRAAARGRPLPPARADGVAPRSPGAASPQSWCARCAERSDIQRGSWLGPCVCEHVVARRRQSDRQGAGQDRRLAQGRDLDARRVGEPLVEQAADGAEEQVAVRSDAAAEDDERDVGDRRDRLRCAARCASPLPPRPCGLCRLRRVLPRTPRARRGETPRRAPRRLRGRGVDALRPSPASAKSISPAAPWRPRCSSPPSTTPAPMPVPTDRKTKSSTPRATPCHCSPSAARLMSFSSVTGRSRASCSSSANLRPSRSGDVLGKAEHARSRARRPPGRRRRRRRRARRRGRRSRAASRGAARSPRRAPAASATPSSTSCRARTWPTQVADRPAHEARAQVEPEHERRLRNRLEVDGAVARPVRPRARLAHEPRVEQRLQRERDGRLRDARPGARSRRARSARRRGWSRAPSRSFRRLSRRRTGASLLVTIVNKPNAEPRISARRLTRKPNRS